VALLLSDDLVTFNLAGFFGWTSFPQAFGVVTRVLIRLAKAHGTRFVLGYCDDFSGVALASQVHQKTDVFTQLIEELLGPGAVNRKKTETGRKVVHTGWELDLDGGACDESGLPAGCTSLSQRNLRKVVQGFFSLPPDLTMKGTELKD